MGDSHQVQIQNQIRQDCKGTHAFVVFFSKATTIYPERYTTNTHTDITTAATISVHCETVHQPYSCDETLPYQCHWPRPSQVHQGKVVKSRRDPAISSQLPLVVATKGYLTTLFFLVIQKAGKTPIALAP